MTFPKQLIIKYDRNGCIGAAACAAINPMDFVMNKDDGKADLSKSAEEDGKFVKIVEVTSEEEFNRIVESAKVCPVNIIEVWDMKTKEKLAPV